MARWIANQSAGIAVQTSRVVQVCHAPSNYSGPCGQKARVAYLSGG